MDETHEAECIRQNIANAKELIQKCNISLIGVESHLGSYLWDDCFTHDYTTDFDNGENLMPVNTYPEFADQLRIFGVPIVGVECQGLANELECNLVDAPNGEPLGERPFNIKRSEHFLRTLFQLYAQRRLSGNLILNIGGNHNSHIENWILTGTVVKISEREVTFIRLRAPAYRES